MKIVWLALMAAALVTGCAHEGGVHDTSYRETGPTRPSSMDREFPGRIGPGSDRLDPALPR